MLFQKVRGKMPTARRRFAADRLCASSKEGGMKLASRLRERWPTEFDDGARIAFLQCFEGRRERGGYPLGFHAWEPERRNAWFTGFNRGRCDRVRAAQREAR